MKAINRFSYLSLYPDNCGDAENIFTDTNPMVQSL